MNDFAMSDAVQDLLEQLDGQTFDSILASTSVAEKGNVKLVLRVGAISREVSYVVITSNDREIFTASHFYDAATRYVQAIDAMKSTDKAETRAELQRLVAAFEENGVRAVELAERIDELRSELDGTV